MACRLAKSGYWGGDPGAVKRAPVDEVMETVQYEAFTVELERAAIELNREGGKK